MKKIYAILSLGVFIITLQAQSLFIDSQTFMNDIEAGSPIEKGSYPTDGTPVTIQPYQWNCSNQSGNYAGSSPLAVSQALEYSGYSISGSPSAFRMATLTSGGRSTVFTITGSSLYKTGSYYLAFLIKVETFPMSGTVGVVMFDGSATANFRKTCLAIRKIDDNTFSFGIEMAENSVGASTPVAGTYNIGTTYLAVMRHDFTDDKYYLYINPPITPTEPITPLVSGTNTLAPLGNNGIRGITVKQRTHYSAIIGGLRLADSWEKALGIDINTSVNDVLHEKGNIVSVDYYSITGSKILKPFTAGYYIKKETFADGTAEWTKQYLNESAVKYFK